MNLEKVKNLRHLSLEDKYMSIIELMDSTDLLDDDQVRKELKNYEPELRLIKKYNMCSVEFCHKNKLDWSLFNDAYIVANCVYDEVSSSQVTEA